MSVSKMRKSASKLGSSLILVTVVIASIIVVVFGAHRLTLVQFNQSTRDEDKLLAEYGAKAALEDGLIRFRHHRNVETTEGNVEWVNLSTNQTGERSESSAVSTVPNFLSSAQYYDLKINFRTQVVGDFDFSPDPFSQNPAPILKVSDNTNNVDSLEISGFQNSVSPYYLRMAFRFYQPNSSNACTNNQAFVQIQQIVEGAADPYQQFTARMSAGSRYDSLGSNFEVNPVTTSTLTTSFRLRPFHCDIAFALATTTSVSGAGVDNNGLAQADAGPKFGGLKTVITGTGYFGEAKRTLVAEINRQSGRLIRIFDFNVYAGEGNIQP